MSDELVFNDEPTHAATRKELPAWQVMVVDDEPAVHEVTKLVMAGFEMEGRKLEFTHCYSAAEAYKVLADRKDIALVLLDVVMETEHAGLDLARQIREELHNHNIRIVLRTGQPGQAPEEQVIRDYDINDYKEKTDLTRRKLITTFFASLRAYRDLMRIEQARQGLRRSIDAITEVYDSHNLRTLASAILQQVNHLLGLNGEGLHATRTRAYTANAANGRVKVLAATDAYAKLLVDEEIANLPQPVRDALNQAMRDHVCVQTREHFLGYFRTRAGSESVIYMEFPEPIDDRAQELLEIFSRNVAVTYDGLLLRESTNHAQRMTISLLGGAMEKKSMGVTPHLDNVGKIAALLAQAVHMDERDIELLRVAAAMHDVGKAYVADTILTKPGPLDPKEWDVMKTHPSSGHELLSHSDHPLHTLAARIALEHHEHWDGTGYPKGLKGEDISIEARIVAIADVFDSLLGVSYYKSAWTMDAVLTHMKNLSGTHFDPSLIAHLVNHEADLRSFYAEGAVSKEG